MIYGGPSEMSDSLVVSRSLCMCHTWLCYLGTRLVQQIWCKAGWGSWGWRDPLCSCTDGPRRFPASASLNTTSQQKAMLLWLLYHVTHTHTLTHTHKHNTVHRLYLNKLRPNVNLIFTDQYWCFKWLGHGWGWYCKTRFSLPLRLIGLNYRFFLRDLRISRDCTCRLHPIPKIRIRFTMVYFGVWELHLYCLKVQCVWIYLQNRAERDYNIPSMIFIGA